MIMILDVHSHQRRADGINGESPRKGGGEGTCGERSGRGGPEKAGAARRTVRGNTVTMQEQEQWMRARGKEGGRKRRMEG